MRGQRLFSASVLWLGSVLSMAAVTAADGGDGSFLLSAPGGGEQRLLVMRARPTQEGVPIVSISEEQGLAAVPNRPFQR
jgi:hypothetical protein